MARKEKDDTPVVMRGKLPDGRITYARIPIINKYPLPNIQMEQDAPFDALYMLIRYAHLQCRCGSQEECQKVIERALRIIESVEYCYDGENFSKVK